MREWQHMPCSRDRLRDYIRDHACKVKAYSARRQRRPLAGYDEGRYIEERKVRLPHRIIERAPEIERHLADPRCQRQALHLRQGLPGVATAPIVDEAAHTAKVVTAVDCVGNYGTDL